MRTVYRLRRRVSGMSKADGTKGVSYDVGMPQEIADRLIAKGMDLFVVELTPDGILYRPTKLTPAIKEIPEWLK